jgi:S-adenosylmethionine synthetase
VTWILGPIVYDLDLDLTPAGISAFLDLPHQDYYQTAKRGHFGHGYARDRHISYEIEATRETLS